MRVRCMSLMAIAAAVAVFAAACGSSTTTPSTVSSIAVNGTAPAVGATAQFTAVATMLDGTTLDVTSTATWTSSNTADATVSATGLVTGVAARYRSGAGDVSKRHRRGPDHAWSVKAPPPVTGCQPPAARSSGFQRQLDDVTFHPRRRQRDLALLVVARYHLRQEVLIVELVEDELRLPRRGRRSPQSSGPVLFVCRQRWRSPRRTDRLNRLEHVFTCRQARVMHDKRERHLCDDPFVRPRSCCRGDRNGSRCQRQPPDLFELA